MASGSPVRANTSTAVSANLITCSSPFPTARAEMSLAVWPSGRPVALRPAWADGRAARARPGRRRRSGRCWPSRPRPGSAPTPGVQDRQGAQHCAGRGRRMHQHDGVAVAVAQVTAGSRHRPGRLAAPGCGAVRQERSSPPGPAASRAGRRAWPAGRRRRRTGRRSAALPPAPATASLPGPAARPGRALCQTRLPVDGLPSGLRRRPKESGHAAPVPDVVLACGPGSGRVAFSGLLSRVGER